MSIALFGDPAALAPPRTERVARADGSFVLRHPEPLQAHARCIGDWLEHWAAATPDAPYLSERDASGGWRRLSYGQVREQVGRIAQALLDMALPAGKPVVVLSDNSVDHALLALAGMHIGMPLCTVSSAYCRLTKDTTKVRRHPAGARPGADLCRSSPRCTARRSAPSTVALPVVFSDDAGAFDGALPFSRLLDARETPAVRRAFESIRPTDTAKLLLTSGSTGHAEGGDQHPPHAHRQPAADDAGVAVPAAAPAAPARLAAVEPHLRRQPQLQHGAGARRQPGHRRGPAGARAGRQDACATCAR